MRVIVLILAIAAPCAQAAAYSLSNTDATLFMGALRASGAPVRSTGDNQSIAITNLICLKAPKTDGTFLQACTFRANGTHQVPAATIPTVMSLLKRAGLPVRGGSGNEVYRVNGAQCATYGANRQAPRTECSFTP